MVEKYKSNFAKHEIEVIIDTPHVKKFKFKNPESYTFSFSLVTSDNLIVMTGDCYSLLIEPGYGRCGLAFLRGSVESESYFLSKCPFREVLTEYSCEQAQENLIECVKDGELPESKLEDAHGLDDNELFGEASYYEFCHANDIDEPASPRVLKDRTKLQLAGLQCFVEKYEKMVSR